MVDQVTRFNEEADLDDIDDLPSFAVFHSGSVLVNLSKQERKEVGDHDAWVVTATLKDWLEPTELPLPGEKLAGAGDVMDIAFMLDNEFGQGKMKEFLAPFKAKLGLTKTKELWEAIVGMDIVLVGKRTPKDDGKEKNKGKDGFNYNVKNIMIP